MANQYKNKIIYGNQTLMDITDTTATENDVLEGEVFYSASGARGVGTLGDATTTTHGLMSATDKTKLNGIAAGAQVNPGNATQSAAGLMSAADKTKLDGVATGATANVGTITGIKMNGASKGTSGVVDLGTVITAHQDISGKADKSSTVSNVSYDSTNNKITKTINGTTSDVVTAATLKTAMSLGNVENKSSATIRSEITSSNVTTALGFTPMNASVKGANNGVAELDSAGKVPASQLPSYVDDVLEYDKQSSFPATGETGKIYVAKDTNKTYRWSGTAYVEISPSLALGETSSTAYRGDRGKTAYDHASAKGSAFASGLYKITTNSEGHVTAATAVAKSDITGLGIPGSDTNTHRPIQVNGTQILGDNTTALNLKAGSNVSVTNSSGTVTIAATDTTYSQISRGSSAGLAPGLPSGSGTTKYLREDGSWQVPPDTNTWRPVQDNLTSTSTTDCLSANQGKVLNANITNLSSKTFSGIDIGSCNSMSALKTALCTLAQNQGTSRTVNFRFYPDFTDTDAGFYPASYGERMGTMYVRTATRFTCIIIFQDGTVTRMSNNNGTWDVDQLALNSKLTNVPLQVTELITYADITSIGQIITLSQSIYNFPFAEFQIGGAIGYADIRRSNQIHCLICYYVDPNEVFFKIALEPVSDDNWAGTKLKVIDYTQINIGSTGITYFKRPADDDMTIRGLK